jgi:hypothetical protein
VFRIGQQQAFLGIFLALADIGFAPLLTPVKTVRINDGVGTTTVRLFAMTGRQLEAVTAWEQPDS